MDVPPELISRMTQSTPQAHTLGFEVVEVSPERAVMRAAWKPEMVGDPATGVTGLDLRAAMSRLDPDDRALLALRFIAGFDSNELAAATGISPSGTRSRIERLLRRLREDLRDG